METTPVETPKEKTIYEKFIDEVVEDTRTAIKGGMSLDDALNILLKDIYDSIKERFVEVEVKIK